MKNQLVLHTGGDISSWRLFFADMSLPVGED
jgi:hypothetical protein